MKPLKKRRVAQKLWGWVSLSINYFIMALFLAEKHAGILGGGILLSAFTLYYGISKISYAKYVDDLSAGSVVIEYIGVYIVTFAAGFKAAGYLSSAAVLIALVVASIVEFLVFLTITNWYAILRFFRKIRKIEKDR